MAHPSADLYGSDRQLLESIAALRDAGWEVDVCLPAGGPLQQRLTGTDVHVVAFPVLRKSLLGAGGLCRLALRAPRDLLRVVRMIRRVSPQLLYVNTLTIPLWLVAARLTRTPVLTHVHEAEQDAPRAIRIALAAPLLLSSAVVANSETSRRALVDVVPRLGRTCVTIPNGVPDPGAAAPSEARAGHLVLTARLSPRKGIDVALEAVSLLRAESRAVTLEVCGTAYEGYEWYEQELRDRARRADLAGAVHFAGYVDPASEALATASVVLVPSRVEPFGNTAVEALFAARPLVASDVQGLAEIVDDGRTGLLVPPGDAAALAAAVGRILDDPLLAGELASQGREDALARFSTQRYRRELMRTVDDLIPVCVGNSV